MEIHFQYRRSFPFSLLTRELASSSIIDARRSELSYLSMQRHASNLPNTIARVFVALRSFLAELFSLFFLLALFALYIVNLDPDDAFFRSFLQEDDSTLGVLASCSGRSEPALFSRFNSCLFAPPLLPFLFVCVDEDTLVAPRVGGGDDEVEEDGGPDVIRGFGLGLEFVSCGSWIIVLLAAPSYPLESFRCTRGAPVSWACATALKRQLPFERQKDPALTLFAFLQFKTRTASLKTRNQRFCGKNAKEFSMCSKL